MTGPRLTSLEKAIVRGVEHGLTDELIAEDLGLSFASLHEQLASVYQKLGVTSRVELLFYLCSVARDKRTAA
jgi:DNA-binding NarL/FixJ family response regulator